MMCTAETADTLMGGDGGGDGEGEGNEQVNNELEQSQISIHSTSPPSPMFGPNENEQVSELEQSQISIRSPSPTD